MNKNIAWIDILRIVSCFMVVLAHCCDPFMAQFTNNHADYMSAIAWGSLMRPCVPLFVMISGFLLLPVTTTTSAFYSRRIKKIVIPLIFWSVITPLLYFGYLSFFETSNPNILAENFTFDATLTKLYTFLFNFTYDTIPLWYLYMLIGVYLFMPIIGAWLNQAEKKEIRLFLIIWGVTMLLPYVKMFAPMVGYLGNYGSMDILGECFWNPYGVFYYFSGFTGYVVLAYYLKKYPLNWSWTRTTSIAVPLFVLGYLITYYGFIAVGKIYPGNYEYLEILWYFSGINVFMMTIAVYLLIHKIEYKGSKSVKTAAGLTFGVFLSHFFLVQVGYDLLYPILDISPYLKIPTIATAVFIVSLGVVWCLSKNKYTSKVIN